MNHDPNPDAERLVLDAKKAILQEQHRRFQELQREGRSSDAMQQLHVTLACAADLLKDSVAMLDRVVNRRLGGSPSPSLDPPDSNDPPAPS